MLVACEVPIQQVQSHGVDVHVVSVEGVLVKIQSRIRGSRFELVKPPTETDRSSSSLLIISIKISISLN